MPDVERPASAVVLRSATLEIFRPLEIRQYFVVAPPFVANLGPVVVVAAVATDVHHHVDGTAATAHDSAMDSDVAPVQLRPRFCLVPLADVRIQENEAENVAGIVNILAGIRAAPFEQQHASILTQPIRQRAARRSGTHDDVIERRGGSHRGRISGRARARCTPARRAPRSATNPRPSGTAWHRDSVSPRPSTPGPPRRRRWQGAG